MSWRESVAKNLPPGSVGFVAYFPDKIESNNEKESETPVLNGCLPIKNTSKKVIIEVGNITHKTPQNPQNPETSLCGQKSFDEITTQEPHREERRDPAGEMPPASEIVAPCSPNAKQTAGEAADELRTERAAIKEFSGNLPREQAESEAVRDIPCYVCDSRTFWVSTYGVIVCGRCHPPATPKLVARWITIPNELGDDEN